MLDEIVLRHASTEGACQEFRRRFGEHRGGVVVYGDASGYARQTTGSSDYQIVREFFGRAGMTVQYKIPKANPQVRDRIQLVNAKLRSAGGEIRLVVDGRCSELIQDLEQVSYKEHSIEVDKDRDRQRTHLSDALGYLVWQECRPRPGVGERAERLV
ncbi:MAG: hypothetical protein ACRD96_19825 [Bryobacteraceae bacterium]